MVPTQGLLKRQLKRFFGNDFNIPAEWEGFLTAVDAAYSEFAVDRDLMERSMELSSQELLEANSELQRDIAERKRAEAKLEQMHRQLVDASRHAGMAEIANNVLHNVGNVLNSVNVSAGVVAQMVRDSKGQGLANVVQLLGEEGTELGTFFAHNEKGVAMRGYLTKLVAALVAEKQAIAKELDSLTKSIDHINEIVAAQQSYSGATSVVEPVQITELLEDALRINAGAIERHQITVVREYAELPVLVLDKHLVLQILVNLIGNSGQAMQAMPAREHELKLRAEIFEVAESRRLRICVEDNGEGIAQAHLPRLFTHGFTTRKNGHGFGLHSCALAAKEMQGAIAAHSDGPGHGAIFTLELPVNPA